MIKFGRPANVKTFTNVLDDLFNGNFTDVLDSDFGRKSPLTNIIENKNAFIIEIAAPGLTKNDFTINVEKDQLIISAEVTSEDNTETKAYKKREFNYTSFKKSFHLNKVIDYNKIGAKYENGILSVTLEKKEEEKEQAPKQIKIG